MVIGRAFLEAEYVRGCKSTAEIAARFGVTRYTVSRWLQREGIPRRSVSEARAVKHWALRGKANGMHGRKGALNPNYVDGSASRRRAESELVKKQRELRLLVIERDDGMCCRCGCKPEGRDLCTHHVKRWAGNQESRFDPDCVVTICRACHEWVHSKQNTERNWIE